jgi:hypothetical protein
MLFRSKAAGGAPVQLKPFVFRVREGFLVGLARDPQTGSPCAGCIELWLRDRDLWGSRIEVDELPVRRDLLEELTAAGNPHTFYEISRDGSATKLECAVFPHPSCVCDKSDYLPPPRLTRRTNFAFSPLLQLSSQRHATPNGNLWVTVAAGPSPLARQPIHVTGSGGDKETARFRAVDQWLQRAATHDAEWRVRQGERLESDVLETGRGDEDREPVGPRSIDSIGVGQDRSEATLNALVSLTLKQTLQRYAANAKNPMLVVGANTWLRERIPFFVLQRYDVHLLFYPTSTPCWVIGAAAFSRLRSDEKPLFVFSADTSVLGALERTLGRLLESIPPSLEEGADPAEASRGSKLNLWWTHWIYRCPKISLSDVLHLEPYTRTLEPWLGYLQDGQPVVRVTPLNTHTLPASLRTVVRITTADVSPPTNVRSLHGIGTWAHFRDALH